MNTYRQFKQHNELGHRVSYKIACPPSNESDRPVQMHKLIITSQSMGSQISTLSLDRWQRFCLECMDEQDDKSLRWAHILGQYCAPP